MTVNLLRQQQQQQQRENLKVSASHLAGGKWQVASGKCCGATRVVSAPLRLLHLHLTFSASIARKMRQQHESNSPNNAPSSLPFSGVATPPRHFGCRLLLMLLLLLLLHLAKMSIVQSLDISRKTRNSRKHKTRDLCALAAQSARRG